MSQAHCRKLCRAIFFAAATCLMSLPLIGCNDTTATPSASGRVAVIDLGVLLQDSGADQHINRALQHLQAQEQQRINQLQTQLGLDKTPTATPSDEELQKIYEAQQELRQAVFDAEQRMNAARLQQLEQFRSMIRPIASRVATANGYGIVIERRDNILTVDDASDITDQVLTELPPLNQLGAGAPAPLPGQSQLPPMMTPTPQTPPLAPQGSTGSTPSTTPQSHASTPQ